MKAFLNKENGYLDIQTLLFYSVFQYSVEQSI